MPRRRKKPKNCHEEPKELINAPHCFVIKRGVIGKNLSQLLVNFRRIMEPFTASKLRVRRKNTIKDFVSMSSYLKVSHIVIFTQSSNASYLRLCKVPRGPTLTYKITEYCLSNDVVANQKRPQINGKLFQNAPLLILNGFGGDKSDDVKIKLQSSMWRNMFPTIDIDKIRLSTIQRSLLLHHDPDSDTIELRHYSIRVNPCGLTKVIKKLVSNKTIPDLGKFQSIDEAIENVNGQDSDAEDLDNEEVILPQKINQRKGNLVNERSSIKLYELGPRIRLKLIKIEDGIMSGEVLFHSYVTKTAEEIKEQKQKIENRNFLRLSRRKQQEQNVAAKMKTIPKTNGKVNEDFEVENLTENKRKLDSEDDCSDYQISEDELEQLEDLDQV
ncbi:suppressor of SWI4 1-like protein [Sarcoptes scabiei]|uniref:Suppressor of SWI4 1-like protein n=1 Tax=Sarcoptes scabiei TaxID=52283 RepID=A0A132AHT4_SARSC|nr:suppressor of SWI4 1-like protein [Sarcoptes scabiei]